MQQWLLSYHNKLERLPHFCSLPPKSNIYGQGQELDIRAEYCKRLHFCRSALLANNRLGWKWMAVPNTLAYHDTATISAVISFLVQANDSSAKKLLLSRHLNFWGRKSHFNEDDLKMGQCEMYFLTFSRQKIPSTNIWMSHELLTNVLKTSYELLKNFFQAFCKLHTNLL